MDRELRQFDDASAYFKHMFFLVSEITRAAIECDGRSTLPFDSIRVFGEEERKALIEVMREYSEANTHVVLHLAEASESELPASVLTQLVAPLILMGFMVGYRHAVNEIEIPTQLETEGANG